MAPRPVHAGRSRSTASRAARRSARRCPPAPAAACTVGARRRGRRRRAPEPHRREAPIASRELHQRSCSSSIAPPSVLVDDRPSTIVHLTERRGPLPAAGAGGEPSQQPAAARAPGAAARAAHRAVPRALQAARRASTRAGRVRRATARTRVRRSCACAAGRQDVWPGGSLLVMFDESAGEPAPTAAPTRATPATRASRELEDELHAQRKEQLRDDDRAVRDLDRGAEGSNEELQAINEELRSATEELETSKEELQSVNEELITVNYELKIKVEETSKVNDDLQNLIASTGHRHRVHRPRHAHQALTRRTPATLFNLIAADIGRPLLDITHRLDYHGPAQDAAGGVRDAAPDRARGRAATDGRWSTSRGCCPTAPADDRIDGAVLTFVDITERAPRRGAACAPARSGMRLMAAERPSDLRDPHDRLRRHDRHLERRRRAQSSATRRRDRSASRSTSIFTPEDRARGVPRRRAAPAPRGRAAPRTSAGTCARTAAASSAAAC